MEEMDDQVDCRERNKAHTPEHRRVEVQKVEDVSASTDG